VLLIAPNIGVAFWTMKIMGAHILEDTWCVKMTYKTLVETSYVEIKEMIFKKDLYDQLD